MITPTSTLECSATLALVAVALVEATRLDDAELRRAVERLADACAECALVLRED